MERWKWCDSAGARLMIANPVNRGFAAAVNQGVRFLGADYILLLNPDAVLQGSLAPLQAACAAPGSGAAGGKLVERGGGAVQAGFFGSAAADGAGSSTEYCL